MSPSPRIGCPVAIFCGGDNLRFGRLARIQAKSLLVTHDTPLLWRLIDQLQAAGFSRIVASTTPRTERHISDSINHYIRTSSADAQIQVVASAEQQRGMIFGLRQVLGMWSTKRCLICLGDIYFRSNPFLTLRAHVAAEYDCLGVAPVVLEEELKLGGIIHEEEDRIRSILERPIPVVTGGPLRWSGIALFHRRRALADLELFATGLPDDPPPGDFFEFQRSQGRDLRCVSGPDFVNVNTPDHLLLASLYARLEATTDRGPLSLRLTAAADALRHDLARGTSPEQPK